MSVKTIDIHGANAHETYSQTRVACRGIVVKDSRILVSHEVKTGIYMIPGGGLEGNEIPEECCVREVREETGYVVRPVRCFLTLNEFYEEYKFISHYFLCDITGEAEKALTDGEIARGLRTEWAKLCDMLEIYSKHNDFAESNEEKRGIYLREYTALREYIELN